MLAGVAVLLTCTLVSAQALPADAQVRAAERALAAAHVHKDERAIAVWLDPSFVLRGDPDVPRAAWIASQQSLCWGDRFELEALAVRPLDAATALATFILVTHVDPKTCAPATVRRLITDVWSRGADGWRLRIRQASAPASRVDQHYATAAGAPRWERRAEISLVATGGNTTTATTGAAAALTWRPSPWQTHAEVKYVRSVQHHVETAESFDASVREARKLTAHADGFVRAQHLIDRFAGLEGRTSLDIGGGWTVRDAQPHTLKLDLGLGVTHEARVSEPDRTFGELDVEGAYAWHVGEATDLTDEATVAQSLAGRGNWRFTNTAALSAGMTRVFAFKISHQLKYQHQPVAGFGTTDTILSASLVARF